MDKAAALHYLRYKVEEDEPVFILRGGDMLAPATIFAWVEGASLHRVAQPKIESAVQTAGEFLRYEGPKKLPD